MLHKGYFGMYFNKKLNLTDIKLISEISISFYLHGFSTKTNKEISKNINKSLSSVEKSINRLKKLGFITTCVTSRNVKNPIRFIYPNYEFVTSSAK